jgi:hypothetical protein
VAVLIGILINNSRLGDLNNRLGDMNGDLHSRLGDVHNRLGDLNNRISDVHSELRSSISDLRSHMDNRFDDARDTWRAELRRVEEVIDARLKHLEER